MKRSFAKLHIFSEFQPFTKLLKENEILKIKLLKLEREIVFLKKTEFKSEHYKKNNNFNTFLL